MPILVINGHTFDFELSLPSDLIYMQKLEYNLTSRSKDLHY